MELTRVKGIPSFSEKDNQVSNFYVVYIIYL